MSYTGPKSWKAERINIERYAAYLNRDSKEFCAFHPQIHPDNQEKIRWEFGEVTEKDGSVKKIKFCPKCHVTLPFEKQ